MLKLKVPAMVALVATFLTLPAFATEGETTTTGMTTILGATDTVASLLTKIFNLMVANPLLVVFLASALIAVGVRNFKRLRRAAGG